MHLINKMQSNLVQTHLQEQNIETKRKFQMFPIYNQVLSSWS